MSVSGGVIAKNDPYWLKEVDPCWVRSNCARMISCQGMVSGGIAPLDARRRLNFVCYADNYRLYYEVDATPTLRDNPWETTWG